ncbi:MAG: glycosyltransferase, partial [Candidatus Dadabacteria bacterium]
AYSTADVCYGISKTYIDIWEQMTKKRACYLDPLRFLEPPDPVLADKSQDPPALLFVGRGEFIKGIDIFLQIVQKLNPKLFSKAEVIGIDSESDEGKKILDYLKDFIKGIEKPLEFIPSVSREDLFNRFKKRYVLVLPSRHDTLNLIGIEAVFLGCPLVLGSGAGAWRFFKDKFSNLPIIKIDIDNPLSCLDRLEKMLFNYDEYRKETVNALVSKKICPESLSLKEIYSVPSTASAELLEKMGYWYEKFISYYNPEQKFLRYCLKQAGQSISLGLVTKARLDGSTLNYEGDNHWSFLRALYFAPEFEENQIAKKIDVLRSVSQQVNVDRVRLWQQLARLEHLRGKLDLACTYYVRVLRALEEDRFKDLNITYNLLKRINYPYEAEAIKAMYGEVKDRYSLTLQYLEKAESRNRALPAFEYEIVDDGRRGDTPKVSVIVSLYNTKGKLTSFLERIEEQTLAKQGAMELILIDSGSLSDEFGDYKRWANRFNIPTVYARTKNRETIQQAWNRGISLSRAPYLSFLGVDEALLPHCLEKLSLALDKDNSLDWVIGHSVVKEVDKEGNYLRDGLIYNRSGYEQDLVYLETCYLSWVGALYRKEIHKKYGYYDPTFRAAGDTEFKNRILPHIKSKAVDEVLGIFLNYPEERATGGPSAELEDVRAWYIHRTPAGVEYAFRYRDEEEVVNQLLRCFGYRKSYKTSLSTDFEYALSIMRYMARRNKNSRIMKLYNSVEETAVAFRKLDYLMPLTPFGWQRHLDNLKRSLERLSHQLKDIFPTFSAQAFNIFNDNRFEQHHWAWQDDASKFYAKVDGQHYLIS